MQHLYLSRTDIGCLAERHEVSDELKILRQFGAGARDLVLKTVERLLNAFELLFEDPAHESCQALCIPFPIIANLVDDILVSWVKNALAA